MNSKYNSDWQEHDQLVLIKAELEYFLAQPGSRVALLKGEWGSGKTTLISKVLEARAHSYISLYGATSINEIKSQFVLSWLTSGSKEPKGTQISNWFINGWQFSTNQLKRFGSWVSRNVPFLTGWAKSWTAKKYSYALPVGFYALLEANEIDIIVFDDIERCHKDIGLNSFLGMVSHISEKSNIKILIVGNLDKITSTPDSDENLTGLEKTVDQVLTLEPPSNWLASLAASETSIPEVVLQTIQDFCEETKTKNIRLLKRACRSLERTILVLKESDLLEVSSLTELATFYLVLTYAKHDVEFILTWNDVSGFLRISKFSEMIFDNDEDSTRIFKAARSLNLPDIPFYEKLYCHIDSGVLDQAGLVSRIRQLLAQSTEIRGIESSEKWQELWALYGDSLRANDQEISAAILKFLVEDSSHMSAQNYEDLRGLAKSVGLDISAHRVEAYSRSIQQAQAWELPGLLSTYQDDPELSQVVQSLIDQHLKEADIDEVLDEISKTNGWNTLDEMLISGMTVEELKEWMVKPGERKIKWIKAAQSIDKSGNVNEAIRQLASESDLTLMRANKIFRLNIQKNEEQKEQGLTR